MQRRGEGAAADSVSIAKVGSETRVLREGMFAVCIGLRWMRISFPGRGLGI